MLYIVLEQTASYGLEQFSRHDVAGLHAPGRLESVRICQTNEKQCGGEYRGFDGAL